MRKILFGMVQIIAFWGILLLGGMSVQAETLGAGAFEMTTSAKSLKEGDKVEVELRVHDMEITALSGYLKYDKSVFEELKTADIKLIPALVDAGWGKVLSSTNDKLTIDSATGLSCNKLENGLLATVTFTVKKATEKTEISLNSVNVCGDIDGEYIDFEDAGETVTIRDITYAGYDACEFSLRLEENNPKQLKAGDIYTVEVYVSNITQPVNGIDAHILYDEEVLELIEVEDGVVYNGEEIGGMEGMNHFETPMYSDDEGVIHAITDVRSDLAATSPGFRGKAVMKMWFKAKKDAQKAEITIKKIAISYIATLYYKDGVSANVLTIGDNAAETQGNVTLSMDDQITTSSEIVVPVKLTQNTGFNALGMKITYDNTALVYDSMEIADNMKAKVDLDSTYVHPDGKTITASFVSLKDILDENEFILLKFHKKDKIAEGTTAMVKVDVTQVENVTETDVVGMGAECRITLEAEEEVLPEEKTVGDVNGDGEIDLLDAVYILQYYNQVRELDEKQLNRADVNASGTVDLVDALLILKYYNGEINAF